MNEQLIVKNFGPIKDATVDFKRVTVFIGPTGGGKSTLAKLAAIFSNHEFYRVSTRTRYKAFSDFNLTNYLEGNSSFIWIDADGKFSIDKYFEIEDGSISGSLKSEAALNLLYKDKEKKFIFDKLLDTYDYTLKMHFEGKIKSNGEELLKQINEILDSIKPPKIPAFIVAERIFVPAIEYSWAGLMRDDIGLPKSILDFANAFSSAKRNIKSLFIPFLKVKYIHDNNQDFILLMDSNKNLRLYETASGIQSVTPLLVLLEHLSRNTEQAQSFIIEEPELNLYPTAQQGLLNWLVEKCAKGENDLTITTHSPYLLAHFNTLLFAYQVAQNHPERADKIAKIVPRESWINPAEFAAYHVEGQQENGVRSIVNSETGLISYNGLDAIASAEATEFEKLLDINAGLAVEW